MHRYLLGDEIINYNRYCKSRGFRGVVAVEKKCVRCVGVYVVYTMYIILHKLRTLN